jgi:hypothetical protein
MDIWTIISLCSAIYLIWYYSKRWRIKKAIKAEEKRSLSVEQQKKKEEEDKEKEIARKKSLLGITGESQIELEKICSWEENSDGSKTLRYTPPFDCSAYFTKSASSYLINGDNNVTIDIVLNGLGRCTYTFDLGVVEVQRSHLLVKNDIVAKFTPGIEAVQKRREKEELKKADMRKKAEEREKAEIAKKVKEKQRKRELEKIVTQELIDRGELFGDQPQRPPIPREIVDAVYRRDGGRCVYCGSTENLQLDHIIPFSKGGATTLENLQLLCQPCNLKKSNHIG